jgi:hypothetical protein
LRPFLLAIALVIGVLAYAWLLPESGFPTWLRLRQEVTQAEQRIELLERQNHALRDEVVALQRDSFARFARSWAGCDPARSWYAFRPTAWATLRPLLEARLLDSGSGQGDVPQR